MGLIHTPRALYSIMRGLWKRRMEGGSVANAGLGADNPHIYTARLGVLDIDYLGHMNKCVAFEFATKTR